MKEEHSALYRKYRPQQFADMIGQEQVVSVLERSVESGNIAHAYLFAGSRGLGKTSIARIFAREIGTSTNDVYEIDAASNRGIDDIREIREGVNTLPFESKYKVYIIDEVHMLTKEAFNALLKTLEEPPAHAIFVLATTETEKLPETVVSRCQVFSFKKPTQNILRDMVIDVAKKEGYSIDVPSAELVALLGDGSYRDTLGTLQKVLTSSKGKKVARQDVEKVTGTPQSSLINDLIKALDAGDTAKSLSTVHTAMSQNISADLFLRLILKNLRTIILLRLSLDLKKTLEEEYSADDFAILAAAAENKESKINSKTILEFLKALERLRFSPIPELPLELAIAELSTSPLSPLQNREGK